MSAPAQPAADAGSTPCRGGDWGVVLPVMELLASSQEILKGLKRRGRPCRKGCDQGRISG